MGSFAFRGEMLFGVTDFKAEDQPKTVQSENSGKDSARRKPCKIPKLEEFRIEIISEFGGVWVNRV
jgi:hypothetical protein